MPSCQSNSNAFVWCKPKIDAKVERGVFRKTSPRQMGAGEIGAKEKAQDLEEPQKNGRYEQKGVSWHSGENEQKDSPRALWGEKGGSLKRTGDPEPNKCRTVAIFQ